MNTARPAPILAITSGEPAGIGPDICLSLAGKRPNDARLVVLADKDLLRQRAALLEQSIELVDYPHPQPLSTQQLEVCHLPLAAPCQAGQLAKANSHYVLAMLQRAHEGAMGGEFAAIVTAPLHKGIINDAGVPFSGHTEFFAEQSHTAQVVMMLAGGGMRVALATTHLPLSAVAAAINRPLLKQVLRIIHTELQQKFGLQQPRILVAGLNPHAGEQGHLGREEIDIINPVIADLRQEGLTIEGAFPADTLFQPFMLKDADAVLAMYHDQGLPVLKFASFGQGVNITLGLPYIRTSVDHGTALGIAGTGKADTGSIQAAINEALTMAAAQRTKVE